MKVSEIMSKVKVVKDNISLKQVAKIMSDENIGSLIVIKGKKISGIITERDIMKNFSNSNKSVSKVMSKTVESIEHNQSIDDAAFIMSKNKIKRLPVMKKSELIGIITATDLIAHSDDLNEEFYFS